MKRETKEILKAFYRSLYHLAGLLKKICEEEGENGNLKKDN